MEPYFYAFQKQLVLILVLLTINSQNVFTISLSCCHRVVGLGYTLQRFGKPLESPKVLLFLKMVDNLHLNWDMDK